MKPVKKDAPRQARRERTLTRLEVTLKGGVKMVSVEKETLNKNAKPGSRLIKVREQVKVPFEQGDIDRINREIVVLKERLGKR